VVTFKQATMPPTPKYDPLRKIDTVQKNIKVVRIKLKDEDTVDGVKFVDFIHPVHFARWLLKHCEPAWIDGALTWKYGEEYKDTLELYNIYKQTV
jgi:hypothetical protein